VSELLLNCLCHPESGQRGDVVGSLLGLELEGHVVLLPPSLVLPVLPLDLVPLLEVHVHCLELCGGRWLILLLLFLWSHITYCHRAYCSRRNIIFIYIIKINLLSWRAISLIKYNVVRDFNQTR
jgi:hypothetical protein